MTVRALAAAGILALLQAPSGAADTRPVWDKPDHFWYRKPVTGGNVWLTVDALHGVKEPLFDHRRLAIELNLKGGFTFTPLTLPFADPGAQFVVLYDGSTAPIQEGAMAIEFVLDDHTWRCDLQAEWDWGKEPPTDYECQKGDPPQTTRMLLPAGAPVRSPDGRWEALIQNNNVAIRRVGAAEVTRILSTDGTAAQPYEPASLHWSRDSKTVVAYRVSPEVWQSESATGSVKGLVVRGEWKVLEPNLYGILSVIAAILPANFLLNASTSALSLLKSASAVAISFT